MGPWLGHLWGAPGRFPETRQRGGPSFLSLLCGGSGGAAPSAGVSFTEAALQPQVLLFTLNFVKERAPKSKRHWRWRAQRAGVRVPVVSLLLAPLFPD